MAEMPLEHVELDAEATKLTGEPTFAPGAGEVTVTTGVAAEANVAEVKKSRRDWDKRRNIFSLLLSAHLREDRESHSCSHFIKYR